MIVCMYCIPMLINFSGNRRDDVLMFITGDEPEIITEVLPKAHCESISPARLSLDNYI